MKIKKSHVIFLATLFLLILAAASCFAIVSASGSVSVIEVMSGDTNQKGFVFYDYSVGNTNSPKDRTHSISGSQSFYSSVNNSDQPRSFQMVVDGMGQIDLSEMDQEYLTFSFWIYSDREVVLDKSCFKIVIGHFKNGGWTLIPNSGAFAPDENGDPVLHAGWNFFCFEIGAVLRGDTSKGTVQTNFVEGSGLDYTQDFENKTVGVSRPLSRIDLVFRSKDRLDADEYVDIWIDDIKFFDSRTAGDIEQKVNNGEALKSVIEASAFSSLRLTGDVSFPQTAALDRDLVIETDGWSLFNLDKLELGGHAVIIDGEKQTSFAITSIESEDMQLVVGNTKKIVYTVYPRGASNEMTIEAENEEIVSVEDGVVTGLSAGSTNLRIISDSDPAVTAVCRVTVTEGETSVGFVNGDTGISGHNVYLDYSVSGSNPAKTRSGLYSMSATASFQSGVYPETLANSRVFSIDTPIYLDQMSQPNLAFGFWLYSTERVTLTDDSAVYLGKGDGAKNGLKLVPAVGIFSASSRVVEKGWNFFCIEIGSILGGASEKGEITLYGSTFAQDYKNGVLGIDNGITRVDIVARAESGSADWYFDDFKFFDCRETSYVFQEISNAEALQAVLDSGIFDCVRFNYDIEFDDSFCFDENIAIDFNGYKARGAQYNSIFYVRSGKLDLYNAYFKTGWCALAIDANGEAAFHGSARFEKMNFAAIKNEGTCDFSDCTPIFAEVFRPKSYYSIAFPEEALLNDTVCVVFVGNRPQEGLPSCYVATENDGLYYYYLSFRTPETLTVGGIENGQVFYTDNVYHLQAIVTPFDSVYQLNWTAEGDADVYINGDGYMFIGQNSGSENLTITVSAGDCVQRFDVTVRSKMMPQEIIIAGVAENAVLEAGKDYQLKAMILPIGAHENIEWSVSGSGFVSVTQDGVLSVQEGADSAVIKVQAATESGTCTTLTLRVEQSESSPEPAVTNDRNVVLWCIVGGVIFVVAAVAIIFFIRYRKGVSKR